MQVGRTIQRSALLAIGVGIFLAQLDGTVMNVVLPSLARAFNQPRLGAIQPVITVYLTATVVLLPILGKVSDRLGRRRLFVAGFAIFGLASMLCSLATSLQELVALRFIQAIGGALLSGTGLALVAAHSSEGRGHSLGRLSIVFALSGLLGPPIGGGLVQAFGWTSVFWLNVPLSLAGIVIAFRFLPQDEPSRRSERPDLVGASLLALATGLLTIGASNAVQVTVMGYGLGWPALDGLSLAIYAALLWWERRLTAIAGDALLDLELLRTRVYGLGLLLAFFSTGVTVTLFVLVPFWLARGWHVQTSALGLVFTPVALGIGVLAPFAGRQSDAIGPRLLTTVGMSVGGVGAALLAWQATQLIWPVLLMAMLCLGASSGLFAAPNNNAVLSAAPQSALSVAGSMLSAARTLGVIVGVSVGGAIYDALRAQHGPNEAARVLFLAAAVAFLLNAALAWAARPETETERRSSRQDNAHALRGDFSA